MSFCALVGKKIAIFINGGYIPLLKRGKECWLSISSIPFNRTNDRCCGVCPENEFKRRFSNNYSHITISLDSYSWWGSLLMERVERPVGSEGVYKIVENFWITDKTAYAWKLCSFNCIWSSALWLVHEDYARKMSCFKKKIALDKIWAYFRQEVKSESDTGRICSKRTNTFSKTHYVRNSRRSNYS